MYNLLRKNIRFLRKKHGWSLEQFGRILGLSKNTISSFESKTTGFSIKTLLKIRDIFNVSLDDLFFKDLTK